VINCVAYEMRDQENTRFL